jgi:hypothetical protein
MGEFTVSRRFELAVRPNEELAIATSSAFALAYILLSRARCCEVSRRRSMFSSAVGKQLCLRKIEILALFGLVPKALSAQGDANGSLL